MTNCDLDMKNGHCPIQNGESKAAPMRIPPDLAINTGATPWAKAETINVSVQGPFCLPTWS